MREIFVQSHLWNVRQNNDPTPNRYPCPNGPCPGTYDSVTFQGKGDLGDGIKVANPLTLKWGDYPE